MIRKVLYGAAATAVLSTLVFGSSALSYVRTGVSEVQEAVQSEVPLEFQIERARTLVADLVPEVRKSLHVVAEEQVEVERLEEAITKRQRTLTEKQAAIATMRDDLESDRTHFVYAGVTYSREDVTRDLARRFDRYQVSDETLQRDQARLEAKRKALASHRQQLEAMLDARKDLEVEIERLQARLQGVRAAEAVTELAIDDSSLTQARTLITQLGKELDVRERLVEEGGTAVFADEIPVEAEAVPVDLTDRIDAYFGGDSSDAVLAETALPGGEA